MNRTIFEIGVMTETGTGEGNPFDAAARHGVHVTQLCNWNMKLCNSAFAKKIRKQIRDCNIRLNSVWTGYSGKVVWNFVDGPVTIGLVPPDLREQRVADLIRNAEFAAECGAPAIATHCGFLPESPRDALYSGSLDAIGRVAARCRELGMEFWFETGQETPTTLLRTIEDLKMDNLGVNFDTANLILYGKANSVDAVRVLGSYIRNVHVKDGLYPVSGTELGMEVPLGKGLARYTELLPALYRAGYRGDLIIEREITGEQQLKDIQKAIVYLKKRIAGTLAAAQKRKK